MIGPWIAATPAPFETFLARITAFVTRCCGYLGERDFRFGE